tara:strand:+ start:1801 stop:2340 length:540 start_codon:yes stop_codon:yes gene_type:complete
MKRMADYTMDDDKWNSRVALIESHIKNNDVGDMEAPLMWNLKQGTEKPEYRKRYWNNITNMFATVDNSPIIIGKRSSLPQAVQDSMEILCAEYATGQSALFASHPMYAQVLRARGIAGYTPYENAESYAKAQVANLKTRLTGYYKNYTDKNAELIQWDGTLSKDGSPNLTVPAVEEAEV